MRYTDTLPLKTVVVAVVVVTDCGIRAPCDPLPCGLLRWLRCATLRDTHSTLQRERDDAMSRAEVAERQMELLRSELGRHQALVHSLEAEVLKLRAENDTLVQRIVDEKAKSMDELNKMNAMVVDLERRMKAAVRTCAMAASGVVVLR